jgi:uncharacterized protein (DUF1697 family)
MGRSVVLLRGINLGSRRRIAMPELRQLFEDSGFEDVTTYVQSGNVVLRSERGPEDLEREAERLIEERFGFEVGAIARTAEELAAVVANNPLADVADEPKRYQVSFLRSELPAGRVEELAALATGPERLVALGRELYAWHPGGVARSRLWAKLAGAELGVPATARNWTTVTKLLELARC